MKVTYGWLKDFVDIKISPEELAQKLTNAGMEVEEIVYLNEHLHHVVVGKILKIERHPNADKLQICQVDIGKGNVQIITAATNIFEGAVVPVSLPGANLANGIIVIATHMFKKGDYISVSGVEGSIVDINFFFTTIVTADNKKVTLPNSEMINNAVINSGASKTRRVDFTFSVAYETDVELVKKIVTDVMKSNGKIYLTEGNEPFCRLKTLGASSIDFFANCWCDNEDYWDVYYYVVENVYNEFKRNNISIPYNQLEVRNRTDKVVMPYIKTKLPKREEKLRKENDKIDLETASLSEIIKVNKKKKAEEKKKKEAKKEAKKVQSKKSK